MLETKFKIVFLLVVLAFAAIPLTGILRGTTLTPFEKTEGTSTEMVEADPETSSDTAPRPEDMLTIPAGLFIRGTTGGGFDEKPERSIFLDAFSIDRYEVTNHHYRQFVEVTRHRNPGPPARYAKNIGRMRGVNQPVVYVSWEDASDYCRWKGKRLPSEAEWEKAMRGVDARLWPWGNSEQPDGANWARVQDGYEVSGPAGTFERDKSPYGVMDGAGNVMEWVNDWYSEKYYAESPERNPSGPEHGTYRVLRGGSYITTGADIRITTRSKMVPDYRDETIGFRCALSEISAEGKNEENVG
ncbi:MAG: SUMF1/EgtB/PvdO family nonheme iron enzyme [Candidatus Latescibacteria bacterium]|nr:SUMF1/EgtB/PvdO family nonheme iron enzyme [Candidatus Latescibacterota bacterium]